MGPASIDAEQQGGVCEEAGGSHPQQPAYAWIAWRGEGGWGKRGAKAGAADAARGVPAFGGALQVGVGVGVLVVAPGVAVDEIYGCCPSGYKVVVGVGVPGVGTRRGGCPCDFHGEEQSDLCEVLSGLAA
jgi:hypothetical protein